MNDHSDPASGKGRFLIGPAALDCNRGDQALLWACIDSIRKVRPGCALAIMAENWDDPEDLQTRQTRRLGLEFLPAVLPNPRRAATKGKQEIVDSGWSLVKMQFRAMLDLMEMLILLAAPRWRSLARLLLGADRFRTYEYLHGCDAIVVKGGGWMYAYRGLRWAYYIWFGLFPLLLARRLAVKVVILPNSYGPFDTRWSRWLTRRVLKGCHLLTAREPESLRAIDQVLPGEAKLFPDMGFALAPAEPGWARDELLRQGVPLDEKTCVGVTMRPWRFPNADDPKTAYQQYVASFAKLLERLVARGWAPVLFAHVIGPHAHEDDRIALRDVMETCPVADQVVLVDADYDCRQIKAMYGHMDYMVCTRFHSAIFAMGHHIPCVALSYQGYKATGIMGEAGLRDFIIQIDDVSPESLLGLFQDLLGREELIRERLRVYTDNCRHRLDELDRLVNDRIGASLQAAAE